MKRSSKKGFTLAELLIVIAIIAVLIAIMIPVFGAQIDKANAAAELANVRAKYSELVAEQMLGGDTADLSTPINSVSIKYSDLKSVLQHGGVITISTTKPTAPNLTATTAMPTVAEGDKLYITVSLGKYFGSFEIDTNVTITNFA